jgi:hypothetical protein
LANVGFFLLVAGGLAATIPAFTAPEPVVHAVGWIVIGFCAAMSIGYVSIQRGLGLRAIGNPRDAVAFLERRLLVERRTAQLVRWVYFGLFVVFVFVFPRVVAGHTAPRLEVAIGFSGMIIAFAITFSAPWWVARRSRRYQEEIGRWRRWMDEQHL